MPSNGARARALRRWRERHGLTQAEAADFWGVTRVWWGLLERGQREVNGPLARIMDAELTREDG